MENDQLDPPEAYEKEPPFCDKCACDDPMEATDTGAWWCPGCQHKTPDWIDPRDEY